MIFISGLQSGGCQEVGFLSHQGALEGLQSNVWGAIAVNVWELLLYMTE